MKMKKIRKGITIAILFILLVFVLVPLVWALTLSFDKRALTTLPPFSLIPGEVTWFNYE